MGRGFASFLALSLLAGLALRLIPFSLPSFTDPDHYYHLRISESIAQAGAFPGYDALSFQGRPHTYYPLFHCIIATAAILTGLPAFYAYAAVSLLCALAAIAATYALAKRIFGAPVALYASAFAALLPAVLIRGAGLARPDSLSFLLLPLLAMALLLAGNRQSLAAAALLGFILPLLHPFTALFACALVAAKLAADFSLGRSRLPHAAWFFIPALASFSYYLRFPLGQLVLAKTFTTSSEMQAFNFEFIAVAIGAAWLFLVFAALKPASDSGRRMLWLWLAGATALSLLASRNIIYAAAPACLLAGAGLNHILSRGIARPLVLCLLGAGLLLGSVLYLSDAGPQYSKPAVYGARWLGVNSAAAVVSYWDKGHLLTYYGARVFIDGYFEFAPDLDARHSLSMRLFHAPYGAALNELYAQGVRYAFVDGKMAADMENYPGNFREYAEQSLRVLRVYDSGLAQAYSFSG
ncbi:MAG: hypothetical protein V1708_03020 [Candidatus Micrarchaeota archaeon]